MRDFLFDDVERIGFTDEETRVLSPHDRIRELLDANLEDHKGDLVIVADLLDAIARYRHLIREVCSYQLNLDHSSARDALQMLRLLADQHRSIHYLTDKLREL